MKKLFLTIIASFAIIYCYAQNTAWPGPTDISNVGIGTTTPTVGKLQINGSVDLLSLFGDTGVAQFNAFSNADFRIIQRSSAPLTLWTNTVERMRIDASGNVGIGTATPSRPLDVNGMIQTNTGLIFNNGKDWDISSNSNNLFFNETGVGTRMTFLEGGNIGIGTATPSEKLTVRDPNIASNASSGIVKLLFDSGNGGGGIGFEKETFNIGGLRFYTQYGFGSTIEQMRITASGDVGIGTTIPDAKLAVNGTIHSKEVKVDLTGWPDYVFKPAYNLASLKDVKAYIDQNHHLPDMPSEQQVAKEGLNLGDMNARLLKKVEELTLYLIEKDKQLQEQQSVNKQQNKRMKKIEQKLNTILKK